MKEKGTKRKKEMYPYESYTSNRMKIRRNVTRHIGTFKDIRKRQKTSTFCTKKSSVKRSFSGMSL